MSFGSGSGGGSRPSSFGGKGSAQKKEHKKKQDYHRRKIKYVEEVTFDFDQLKVRTTTALQKLGQQVFSTEPGSYSFQDWMKSFNFLLDDFEEKVGASNLPKEYFDRRLALTSELVTFADTSDIDKDLERIRAEQAELNNKILARDLEKKKAIEERRSDTTSKIDALKKEQRESEVELASARDSLEEKKKKAKKSSGSSSFFKRLFSSSKESSDPDSIEGMTIRIKALERKSKDNEEQLEKLQEERNSLQSIDSSESSQPELNEDESRKLDSLQQELADLETKKAQRLQLAEKRAEITGALSTLISNFGASEEKPSS